MKQTYYCWRVVDTDYKDPKERLLVPMSSDLCIFYFDVFLTKEEALSFKKENAPGENWILCTETIKTVDQ